MSNEVSKGHSYMDTSINGLPATHDGELKLGPAAEAEHQALVRGEQPGLSERADSLDVGFQVGAVGPLEDHLRQPVAKFFFGLGCSHDLVLAERAEAAPAAILDVDVVDLVRVNEVLSLGHGFFGFEGVTFAHELAGEPGAPHTAVAQVADLRSRFGDPHCQGIRHLLVLWSGFSSPPISHSTSLVSQRHCDGPLPRHLEVTL
jgi:hypothetical protein